jgi:endonuclease/exonuclease/phosphatase family metal-dependent hydrolase
MAAVRLRVLTLNVWGLFPPIARDVPERMRAIGAGLPELELDVAALQEVWTEEARTALVAAGGNAGLEHVWHNPEALGGSGLLVLSRLPIAAARFERFDLGGFPHRVDQGDYFGGKGFAELTLSTDVGEVALIDTHLQAGYGARRFDAYIGHRTAQVVEIAARLRQITRPVIAAGDFNFQDMYQEYTVLTGLSGLRDAARDLDQRRDTVLRGPPYRADQRGSSARVDYIFGRSGSEQTLWSLHARRVFDQPIEIGGRDARFSDHAGVLVDFEIAPGGSPVPPPDRDALQLARRLLTEGRDRSHERRSGQRIAGVAGLVALPLAGTARRSRPLSRRRFLRACCLGGAALAAGLGAGALWLSETFGTQELLSYDASLRTLDAIEGGG